LLHTIDSKNELTVIATNWIWGQKNILAAITHTQLWKRLRNMEMLDCNDIATDHEIHKRETGIAYII